MWNIKRYLDIIQYIFLKNIFIYLDEHLHKQDIEIKFAVSLYRTI